MCDKLCSCAKVCDSKQSIVEKLHLKCWYLLPDSSIHHLCLSPRLVLSNRGQSVNALCEQLLYLWPLSEACGCAVYIQSRSRRGNWHHFLSMCHYYIWNMIRLITVIDSGLNLILKLNEWKYLSVFPKETHLNTYCWCSVAVYWLKG